MIGYVGLYGIKYFTSKPSESDKYLCISLYEDLVTLGIL